MIPNVADAALAISQSLELSVVSKATVMLALGLVAARLAMHARASIRHLLLAATFAAVVAVPLAAGALPALTIGVPAAAPARPATVPVPPAAAPVPREAQQPPSPIVEPHLKEIDWAAILRWTWIGGSGLFLLPLAFVLWRLGRLRRTGLPWTDRRDDVRGLAVDAGVDRRVEILLHEDVPSPITFGLRRPVIVMPADARQWPEADLRRALVHELEHVRRGDWAIQAAARATCALYWFHPLAWMAWRRMSLEAERACDDAVVAREESTAYAEQLVALAARLNAADAQPTLGMANRSDLSTRVSALLDEGQRRGRAGAGAALAAIAAMALVVIAVAPVKAVPIAGTTLIVDERQDEQPEGRRGSRAARALDRELYEAAEAGDVEGITEMLTAGANVNAAIDGDGSPLIGAARGGRIEAVRLLLDRGADPNMGVDGDGNPLIAAADRGDLGMVRLLLDRGANPNTGVLGDGSALIAASGSGHLDVIELLLAHGADIELIVPGDENPLIHACETGQLAAVKLLVSRGANVNARAWAEQGQGGERVGEWRTPLSMARRNGHGDVVAFLLSAGARE